MARICEICGKNRQVGNYVSHAKNRLRKVFLPNLQTVNAKAEDGSVKKITVCTRCIKAGKVHKASK